MYAHVYEYDAGRSAIVTESESLLINCQFN